MLRLAFRSILIEWRGPAPFVFAPVPAEHVAEIERIKTQASYGWGVIPVEATLRGVTFTTSLFPKDGTYLLPLKVAVRSQTGVTVGDAVDVTLVIGDGESQTPPSPMWGGKRDRT